MENLSVKDVVMKLVGDIQPVGSTQIDNERYGNLKKMCDLVDSLVHEIRMVNLNNKGSEAFSVKRAADYAGEYIESVKS